MLQDLLPDGRARFGVNGHDVVAGWQGAYMDAASGISPADALYELPACAEYGHAADSFAGLGYTVTLAASIASAPDVPIRNADGWNADE